MDNIVIVIVIVIFIVIVIVAKVALCARAALARGVSRVLIVDWDVHHGQVPNDDEDDEDEDDVYEDGVD